MLQAIEPVGDKVLQRHLSSHDCLHKLRDLSPGFPSTKSCSSPFSSSNKLERSGADLLSCSCNTNHNGLSPSSMCNLQGTSHDIDIASAIKSVIITPFFHSKQSSLDISPLTGQTVDKICCSQLQGSLSFGIIDVNGNNPLGSCNLGCLDDRETKASQTKDCYSGAGFHLGIVEDSSPTSGDPTTQQTTCVQVCTRVYLGC